eukprot:6194198-Pleurochrysis_carterae.AAC.1
MISQKAQSFRAIKSMLTYAAGGGETSMYCIVSKPQDLPIAGLPATSRINCNSKDYTRVSFDDHNFVCKACESLLSGPASLLHAYLMTTPPPLNRCSIVAPLMRLNYENQHSVFQ